MTQQAAPEHAAPRAGADRRAQGQRAGSVAAGLRRQHGQPDRVHVRGSDWTDADLAVATRSRSELDSSGLAVDLKSDYQLGPPELAVSPDRPRGVRRQRQRQRHRDDDHRADRRRRTVGQYSTAGRRMNIDMRLLAGQRTRPEDLQLLRVRSTTRRARAAVAGDGARRASRAAVDQPRQPPARDPDHRNVAPGHAQSDALGVHREAAGGDPARLRDRAVGSELAVRRRDVEPAVRARRSASSSRTWCSRRSSTRCSTR